MFLKSSIRIIFSFLLIFLSTTFFYANASNSYFRDVFINLVSDKILDKKDILDLKKLYYSNQNDEIAKSILDDLEKFTERTKLYYSLQNEDGKSYTELKFVVTSTYFEDELISGNTILEKISNISQKDNFDSTDSDEDRCAIASLINSYLFLGGNFNNLSSKFGLTNDLSYKNVHLLQDIIYKKSNTDNSSGIYSGYNYYSSTKTGEISKIIPTGEIVSASKLVGVKLHPLTGNTINSIPLKKDSINNFFYKYPNGALVVGVTLNKSSGAISKPHNVESQNHFVSVFRYKNNFYLSDTSSINNGNGKNVKIMSKSDINNLLMFTYGIMYGVTLDN